MRTVGSILTISDFLDEARRIEEDDFPFPDEEIPFYVARSFTVYPQPEDPLLNLRTAALAVELLFPVLQEILPDHWERLAPLRALVRDMVREPGYVIEHYDVGWHIHQWEAIEQELGWHRAFRPREQQAARFAAFAIHELLEHIVTYQAQADGFVPRDERRMRILYKKEAVTLAIIYSMLALMVYFDDPSGRSWNVRPVQTAFNLDFPNDQDPVFELNWYFEGGWGAKAADIIELFMRWLRIWWLYVHKRLATRTPSRVAMFGEPEPEAPYGGPPGVSIELVEELPEEDNP